MAQLGDELVDGVALRSLLDELPTGVLVVDGVGTVRYANRVVLDLLGWPVTDHIGRSLLDVIAPSDLVYAVELIADGQSYFGSVMGPMRIRFVDADGRARFTEFWARELSDHSGYVLVAPQESSVDTLSDAVQAIAGGAPIEEAIGHVVASCGVNPMAGVGCVLRFADGELIPLTPWPLGDAFTVDAERSTPWQVAGRSGLPIDVSDVDELDDRLRGVLDTSGFRSLWCRPVLSRRSEVSAVMVLFRNVARAPSPNQTRRFDDIVAVAALAFDQLEYRTTLEQAAFTDALTGAATRARLHQELALGIDRAGVLYVDLDGFKEINDTYGHLAGDIVLADAVRRIGTIVREDDLIVRIGGDEFVVVLRNATPSEGQRIAERIVESLAEPYELGGAVGAVVAPASVGVCVQLDGHSFDDAVRLADEALSVAKRTGKSRFHVADRWATTTAS